MPAIKPERKEMQRNRIVDGTVRAIVKNGLASLSVSDIIHESGLSAGAIYGYFDGKEDIVQAAADKLLGIDEEHISKAALCSPVPTPSEVLVPMVTRQWLDDVPPGAVVQIWGHANIENSVRVSAIKKVEAVEAALGEYFTAWFAETAASREEAEIRAAELKRPALGLLQGALVQMALGMDAETSLSIGLEALLAR